MIVLSDQADQADQLDCTDLLNTDQASHGHRLRYIVDASVKLALL